MSAHGRRTLIKSSTLWSSGQPSERDISFFSTLGIEAVINLALPISSNALPGEAEFITRHGMTYVQIPVAWEDPKPEQFLQFVGVLNAFRGHKIWVHCAKNMRASAFIYLYRKLVLGEEDREASFPMQAVWCPNKIWQEFIDKIHSNHSLQRTALTDRR